jgi:hypothetical protein
VRAQREAGRLRGPAVNLGIKGEVVPTPRQAVREAAGRRHLVHRHRCSTSSRRAEGLALQHRRPQADPDAEHGHGGAVRGPPELHRAAVDRRAVPLHRHGAGESGRRVKWHLLARMIPFVENNYNCCELGPRGTGKSHIYKEISPNSILISGGQTTVANLFYNMARRRSGWSGLGCGGLRRGGRHLLQGQGRRADHEGLHGLGVLRPRQGRRSRPPPAWSSSATSTSRWTRW